MIKAKLCLSRPFIDQERRSSRKSESKRTRCDVLSTSDCQVTVMMPGDWDRNSYHLLNASYGTWIGHFNRGRVILGLTGSSPLKFAFLMGYKVFEERPYWWVNWYFPYLNEQLNQCCWCDSLAEVAGCLKTVIESQCYHSHSDRKRD